MISAALSNARAIAMKEQRYAGIRFQVSYNPDNPLRAEQYMIFIIHDPALGAYFFRAIEGIKPIKLPQNVGVMDFTIVYDYIHKVYTNNQNNPVNPIGGETHIDNPAVDADDLLAGSNGPKNLSDTGTFSIIFSPTGNLVIHGVRVWRARPKDDVFNEKTNVKNGIGMFYYDDYFAPSDQFLNLGPEPSRRQFYIYEQDKFKRAYEQVTPKPYSGYLIQLKPVYINSYTGTIISAGQ
jgi:hypothetical protein